MAECADRTLIVLGGLRRLGHLYAEEAVRCGFTLKAYNECPTELYSKIGKADALVLFTGRVSHRARREALKTAAARRIPVFMCPACGIRNFRTCLGRVLEAIVAAPAQFNGSAAPLSAPPPRACSWRR